MKLKINTIAGIFDIIASVMYFIAPVVGIGAAFSEAFEATEAGSTESLATGFMVFALIGLVLHIVALVKSKKANISNVGNILGIIANAIVLVLGLLLAFPAMVLSILSAVFTLRQKQLNSQQ
ncbi:hypothetical protein GMB70_14160 [Turicibacter sanguinis]|nr:hypothetical protein [Turicibacter sanguinis]